MIINMNLWNDIVTDRGMYLFQKSVYLYALFLLFLFLLALGISVMVVTILVRSIVTIDAIRWFCIQCKSSARITTCIDIDAPTTEAES